MTEKIIDTIQCEEDDKIVKMWNELQDAYRYDEHIFYMWVLNDLFTGQTVTDFLNAIDMSNFDLNNDYFVDSIYGLKSISDIYDVIDFDELAEYIEEEMESFGIPELEEILENADE